MARRMTAVACVLSALLLAGCQRTLYDKAVTIDGVTFVHDVDVDAPTREQKVAVEFSSPGVPVDVWVVLTEKKPAVKNKLMGRMRPDDADVLGGKEQSESGTVEATVPAGKEYTVLVGRASKKTEVKLKVMGK
jgi:hypothetical protein